MESLALPPLHSLSRVNGSAAYVIRLWGYLYELDELASRKNNASERYRAQDQLLATIGSEKRFLVALTIEKAPSPTGGGLGAMGSAH